MGLHDALPIYVCRRYAYSENPHIDPHQFSFFFLAYTQADVKSDIFVELPICFGVERSHPREWVVILDKKLYVLKDSVLAWFDKLKEGLEARGFVQSQVDPCVWYK